MLYLNGVMPLVVVQINEYILLMMEQNWHLQLLQRFFLLWVREVNDEDHLMVSLCVWETVVHDVLVLSGVLEVIKPTWAFFRTRKGCYGFFLGCTSFWR